MDHAWRLTFGLDGDAYTLVSMRRLLKRLPPGVPKQVQAGRRCVELRDPAQKVLYRRSIDALVPETWEYPTGDPAQPLARVAVRRRREVSLLVPAWPQGRTVAIVALPTSLPGLGADAAMGSTPQAELARELITVALPAEAPAQGETP